MNTSGKIILQTKGLSVHARSQKIIENISISLHENEIFSIVGPSGSGKSTLLRVLNRLADIENRLQVTGEVTYLGKSIFSCCSVHELRRQVGMVFQKPCIFPGSIARNILFGARHLGRLTKLDQETMIESVLHKAHLWSEVKDRLKQPASELSLGQKQRLAFARVLAVNPSVLLLDEPTSSLDPHSSRQIESALLEMKASKSILLVTHDLGQSRRISDRTAFLSVSGESGQIIEMGPTERLFSAAAEEETREFLQLNPIFL